MLWHCTVCHVISNTATLYQQDRREFHAEDGDSRFILDDGNYLYGARTQMTRIQFTEEVEEHT